MKLFFASLVVVIICASCHKLESPIELKSSVSGRPNICKVMHKVISSYVKLPGEFFPYEEVVLYPKVTGFVKTISVDRGSLVKQGQVLLVMEAPEVQQQLAGAQSKLAKALAAMNTSKAKFERLTVTAKTPGSVSPFDLESALNEYTSAQEEVKAEQAYANAYQAMNAYLEIKAPFDGVITQRNVHPGALVGPNTNSNEPLLVLKEINRLRLTVYVPEIYVNKLDVKRQAIFTINSIPGKEFKGTISRTSLSVDSKMRSEAIEIDVTKEAEIRPGMYAEVKLPVMSVASSFLVPSSAIMVDTERKCVVSIDSNKHAHLIDVNEGISNSDSTEVFGNLKGNEDILVNPNSEIKEGQAIL